MKESDFQIVIKEWIKVYYCRFTFSFILRSIYVLIMYSYRWFDYILGFISLGISLLIVVQTSLYYLVKRNRKQKRNSS